IRTKRLQPLADLRRLIRQGGSADPAESPTVSQPSSNSPSVPPECSAPRHLCAFRPQADHRPEPSLNFYDDSSLGSTEPEKARGTGFQGDRPSLQDQSGYGWVSPFCHASCLRSPSMSDTQPHAMTHPELEQARRMSRIAIEATQPVREEGRLAAEAVIGQPVVVGRRVFAEGREQPAAAVCWRQKGDEGWRRAPLKRVDHGRDIWQGQFTATQVATHEFRIEAWWDVYESYRYELSKKHAAGVPVGLELTEGRLLVERAVQRAQGETRAVLDDLLHRLDSAHLDDERVSVLLAHETAAAMAAADPREHCSAS